MNTKFNIVCTYFKIEELYMHIYTFSLYLQQMSLPEQLQTITIIIFQLIAFDLKNETNPILLRNSQ